VDELSSGSAIIAGARHDGPGNGTEVRDVEGQLARPGYDPTSGRGQA